MKRFLFIIVLLPFQLLSIAQDSLSIDKTQKAKKTPIINNAIPENLQLSHIEIQEQFIDFQQLNDFDYRQKFIFGEVLSQSFDSLVPFYHYPTSLDLPHYLDDLTFYFTAIEWKTPHKIKYSYYLDGFEKDWSEPSVNAFAAYQSLGHGAYTLKVKAMGEGLIWSEPFTYTFSIRRPWWLSWWAYVMYACIVVTIGMGLYNFAEQRKAEVVEIERLIAENRLLAFSNMVIKKPPTREGSFLNLVNQTLEAHLSDENFGIAELCEVLKISRAQLHRKLKKLTGQSTSHYIRSLRLDIAKGLLEKSNLNVSEVAFTVGFSNANYFSKVFKEEFGFAPKEAR